MRHHAQHLQRAVEQVFRQAADAGGQAERKAKRGADRKPCCRAQRRYEHVAHQLARLQHLPECQRHGMRRRQFPRRQDARIRQALPRRDQQHGYDPGQIWRGRNGLHDAAASTG